MNTIHLVNPIATYFARAEIRLHSPDRTSSVTFNGTVRALDYTASDSDDYNFLFDKETFKRYNKGQYDIGEHNFDKNGELCLPIMFKVFKKEFPLSSSASCLTDGIKS